MNCRERFGENIICESSQILYEKKAISEERKYIDGLNTSRGTSSQSLNERKELMPNTQVNLKEKQSKRRKGKHRLDKTKKQLHPFLKTTVQSVPTVQEVIKKEVISKLDRTRPYTDRTLSSVPAKKIRYSRCARWKMDRQDWTLRYLDDLTHSPKDCSKPVMDSTVRRIIYQNGSIVYNGCTKETSACRDRARYDFKTSERINSPPCCRFHILSIFEQVTKELRKQNVSHCMISGGVIGWVRNGKMVPYDTDLDLVITNSFWNTTQFWQMLKRLKRQFGYQYDLVEAFKLKIYLSDQNRNGIDVWAYSSKKQVFEIVYYKFKAQAIGTMLPFREVQFEWFKTFIPNKAREYLNKQYGKERWEKEKQCMVRDEEDSCW